MSGLINSLYAGVPSERHFSIKVYISKGDKITRLVFEKEWKLGKNSIESVQREIWREKEDHLFKNKCKGEIFQYLFLLMLKLWREPSMFPSCYKWDMSGGTWITWWSVYPLVFLYLQAQAHLMLQSDPLDRSLYLINTINLDYFSDNW